MGLQPRAALRLRFHLTGGAQLDDVIEVALLLTRPEDFEGLNEEYSRWFESDPPARYVARLGPEPPGVLISIRMTAFVG